MPTWPAFPGEVLAVGSSPHKCFLIPNPTPFHAVCFSSFFDKTLISFHPPLSCDQQGGPTLPDRFLCALWVFNFDPMPGGCQMEPGQPG